MIKFGDSVDFNNVLKEVEGTAGIVGGYSCPPCDDCKEYTLNSQKYINELLFGPSAKWPTAGSDTDPSCLRPDIDYRENYQHKKLDEAWSVVTDKLLNTISSVESPLDLDNFITEAIMKEFVPENTADETTNHYGLLNIDRQLFKFGAHFTEWIRTLLKSKNVRFYESNTDDNRSKGIKLMGGQSLDGVSNAAAQIIHEQFFHGPYDSTTGQYQQDEKSPRGNIDAGCITKDSWNDLVNTIAGAIAGTPRKIPFQIKLQHFKVTLINITDINKKITDGEFTSNMTGRNMAAHRTDDQSAATYFGAIPKAD